MARITATLTSGMAVQLSNGRHKWKADEPLEAGGTDTGPTVPHRLVGDAELPEVVAHHVGLDLNRGEDLAVVHANDAADHLRPDDHVAQVRLNDVRLVIRAAVFLGLIVSLQE